MAARAPWPGCRRPRRRKKLKADEAKARAGWADKVAAYQLCLAQDKAAARYYSDMKAKGKETPPAATTAPCADPGPFVASAPAADGAAKIAAGPSTAPIAAPSDHKPAAAPGTGAVQSPRTSP
ncbi:signal peptide protein [Cupriavidus basilensis OR16]|uniref:Signal peptide protein n=1 Tax=Cupriavidus basilensis OR16 TaxID=1127483 RepID=H1SAI1_9BURK|nr:signal peptide protein [Cupriavidus basilensis OR16]